MGEQAPQDDGRTSHGMCPACIEHFVRQWKGLDLDEYLNNFEKPVFVVDSDRRLIACNRPAEKSMGWDMEAVRGLRTGEFMECGHARLPEGCGQTIHCRDCQLRISIKETMETGEARINVPAYQASFSKGLPQTRLLTISTMKVGQAVAVTIENMEYPDESVSDKPFAG